MAGIAAPPAEGRWDVAAWDGDPSALFVGVWDGDARTAGISLLQPGMVTARHAIGGAGRGRPRAGAATVGGTSSRPGNAGGGGRSV